jgi:hypothetical protein
MSQRLHQRRARPVRDSETEIYGDWAALIHAAGMSEGSFTRGIEATPSWRPVAGSRAERK